MPWYMGKWSTASCFFNLDLTWEQIVIFASWLLHPFAKNLSTHWFGGWLGPSSGTNTVGEHRNLLWLPRMETQFLSYSSYILLAIWTILNPQSYQYTDTIRPYITSCCGISVNLLKLMVTKIWVLPQVSCFWNIEFICRPVNSICRTEIWAMGITLFPLVWVAAGIVWGIDKSVRHF